MKKKSKTKAKVVFDWLFRDSGGAIVIAQAPNWPMYAVIGFYLLRFVDIGILRSLSLWGGRISLLYWAYLEIFQGVNGFRRILGVCVAAWVVLGILGF